MDSFEPVDIDRDGLGEGYDKSDDDIVKDLELRFNKLTEFNETLNESTDEDIIEMTEKATNALKGDTIELVANQIYNRLTIFFNNDRKRLGIQGGEPIIEPMREYRNFKQTNNRKLSYVYKRTVIDFGNTNNRLKAPWEIRKLGVAKLRLMGFRNLTYEDINPYDRRSKRAREEVMNLNENLDERSKAIESSSTTDAEAIEMTEVTSKDIDATAKDVEQDTSFIESSERDKLLPLRELEELDKQLRTIKGSLKVAIAKRVDLEGRIKHEERKLNEIQDPKYSDDQRDMIEGRINKLRDELTERNKEIDILKGEASKQINQIKESITKFLDRETGTLGERIRTLFKEQGITIVSILTAVGMAIGVLIEALSGGPSASTPKSGGTSGGDTKGGAREWIKNKLKALSQLLGKLADKALASLPGTIGSIISWILSRAKEMVGWLVVLELVGSHNRCWSFDLHIFHDKCKEEINCQSVQNVTTSIRYVSLLIYT